MSKNTDKNEITNKIKEQQIKTRKAAKKTIDEYKNFAIKGNVMDMAIGVVIGGAFTTIVNTIVSALISPLIAILTNKVNLSNLFITLYGPKMDTLEAAKASGAITLNYGDLLNAILNFFIISFTLFIVVRFLKKSKKKDAINEAIIKEETTKACPYCLSSIPKEASKCAFCTSDLTINIDNTEAVDIL